jgi:predicted Zn-dependent protease with MMP-like domain
MSGSSIVNSESADGPPQGSGDGISQSRLPARRRRDRHGRGLRGMLAQRGVPITQSRSDAFDAMVMHAIDHLQPQLAEQLRKIEFAVEDVPAVTGIDVDADDVLDDNSVPLSRLYRGGLADITSPVIVLYRRPLESRASRAEELAGLVHDVVVEQVARLLNTTAEEIDPGLA